MTPTKASGGGRKNSQHSNQNLDFETLLSAWGSSSGATGYGGGGNGVAGSSSGLSSARSGSSSTPSTGEDPDGTTSVTSVSGSDEVEDGATPGNMSVVSSPAIPPAVVFGGSASPIPIPPSRNHAGPKPVGSPIVPNGSPPRPINKKARTSLTASAPTSAGVPTTVEPAGTGRKRRSTVVTGNAASTTASSTGTSVAGEVNGVAVDGSMVDGMLMNGVDGRVEAAQFVGREQPGTGPAGQGQSQSVQRRNTAKAKKRRG
ncbi:hypothetical protein M378DRAFT_160015 [Amanita muscaria Koide BX008]|uniref:Uncharacterized protein n=1 Tax=Amanita muscaria (strain Koide BX008) TaxID=946122 RepID=A0A0C2XCE7_AMAMK|nr:hypothetical protein M378DRAFT_160015 [Amanita muscaria Koide BX008]